MRTKNLPVEFKAGEQDGLKEGEFIVYPSTFTKTPDSYGDIVAPGAFDDTLKAWKDSGNVLPGLYGHRLDDPDYFIASATDMGVDDHGWWVKGEFDLDSPKGLQVYRLVKGKRLSQLSFAFDVLDEGPVELEDGVKANELRALKVYEFSFVPVGANQDTSVVEVKSALVNRSKAGRSLSSKNEDALRAAVADLESALKGLKDVLGDEDDPESGDSDDSGDDEDNGSAKASGQAEDDTDEETSGSKSQDQSSVNPSAGALQFALALHALSGQKGDSE